MSSDNGKQSAVDFAERVRVNQGKLRSGLKTQYDFIVCGSGSSGSVVARILNVPHCCETPDWRLREGFGQSCFSSLPTYVLNLLRSSAC